MLTTIANHFVKFPLKKTLPVEGHMTSAAVLVVLWGSNDDPKVILTQRSEHLKSHAGEVAFPGGKWDPEDTDLLQTALRETFEEIGALVTHRSTDFGLEKEKYQPFPDILSDTIHPS